MSGSNENYALLSTALVNVFDSDNNRISYRILLDAGAQVNLITRNFVSKLKIKTKKHAMSIVGIDQIATCSNEIVTIKLESRYNKFQANIECLVTDRITDSIPLFHINKRTMSIPKNIQLADPQFNVPSQVQMLIRVDLFWQLICIGQIKPSSNSPTIQKTHLGWIIAGNINNKVQAKKFNCSMVNNILVTPDPSITNIECELSRFWQLENNFSRMDSLTSTERECEEGFLRTIKRNDEGRFIATLPIKHEGAQQLGKSLCTALSRFYKLERRFEYNQQLKYDYVQFMREYVKLNHMRLIDENEAKDAVYEFYLPHHPVFKESSITTKLRVVFDGSCKSDSGISLNDILLVGPVVQSDLISILLKFRTFKYVFVANISKMYRQILVDDTQTSLQRIFWREHDNESISTYELKTLTYGTASASYIATRCLKYLAEINHDNFPLGSEAIINDFYVDDLLTADSIEEAITKRDQIIAILAQGNLC